MGPHRTVIVSALVLAAVAVACGSSPPPLHAADYQRNCGADSDCIPIADASDCVCPLCNNRAINRVDQQAYNDALKAYNDYCQGTQCSNVVCTAVTAYCANGTCEVQ
jgi:hypothetical protein